MPEPTHPLAPHIERILDAARIAPSRDNMQPWRFVVEGETVSFLVDHERDRSPANAGGRMARIAVGAALECALLRAGRMGATVHFEAPRAGALVTLTITSPKRSPEPDKALVKRATNRQMYDGRPLDDATFGWLNEATSGPPTPITGPAGASDTTKTLWFGRERVRVLGPLLEEGELLSFGETPIREAALRALRFDVRDREEVTRGLSLGCLELSAAERMTLDSLRNIPADRLAASGAFKKMGARERRLVESASGVCLVTARSVEPGADVAVGRSMQRAWLALTRRGLVAQPMMAIPALEAVLDLDAGAAVPLAEGAHIREVVESLRGAFPSIERGSRIGVLMRIGWAAAPTSQVRRMALDESVASVEATPQ